MNRQERRQAARRGAPAPARPATQADAKRLIDQAFEDRISWVAARVLLERVLADPASPGLDEHLRASIAIFLERHPEPPAVQVGQPRGGSDGAG